MSFPYTNPAQGSCSSIFFHYCMELMQRKRQIEVFPHQTDIVVRSLFPVWLFEEHTRSCAEENLKRCVNMESADDPLHVYLGEDKSQVFWLKPELLPSQPTNGVSMVELWVGNEFYPSIRNWYQKASNIQENIADVEECLWKFFEQVEFGSDILQSWPEIFDFVLPHVIIPEPQLQRKGKYKRRAGTVPQHEDRGEAMIHLAGATLLKPYNCHAWVDFLMETRAGRR